MSTYATLEDIARVASEWSNKSRKRFIDLARKALEQNKKTP